ncbi:MAG: carbohydrate binding family 9 domain-containing protein [Rubrivivax sp.]|nr:carbohydrate binding family 9 domain-containing protein [Rubrivivax sp.]
MSSPGPSTSSLPRLATAALTACITILCGAPKAAQPAAPSPSATFVPAPAAAAAPAGLSAARLQPGERLVLDGSLSHPAWQRAPAHTRFVEQQPRNGAAPVQRTQVQLLFDERALYVGVIAYDTQPQQIRDVPVRYDSVNRTQDFVVAYIDPIGDKASAQFFRVNAAGSLADGIQTAVDDSEDFSPDFDWDAAVQRRSDGWSAVLRIPFASLRFAEPTPGAPARPWRFMLGRRLPRDQFHMMLSVDLPRGSPSFIDQLQPLEGVALPSDHGFLTLRPSLTLRRTAQSQPGSTRIGESHQEASLDLKWRPRAELVVDATIKPDFSQIALDVPQLAGNSRFALFLPEKRPFFFESADLLRSPTDALYTRSITQPRGGLRATWRSPSWVGTALAASDLGGGGVLLPGPYGTDLADQPGSRVLVARGQRRGGPQGWTFGGLLASRDYEEGRGANHVAGIDADGALGEGWRARAQLLASQTTALPFGGALRQGPSVNGHRAYGWLQRLRGDSESVVTLDDISAGFRHDTGFVNQNGVRSLGLHQAWKWQQLGPFNSVDLYVDAREVRDRADGQTVERTAYLGFWSTAARNLEWWAELHPQDRLRTAPGLTPLTQRFLATGLVMTPAPWWPLVDTQLSLGRLADTVANQARPGARWRFSARLRPLRALELEPSLSKAWLYDDRGPTRRLAYQETAAQGLAIWHLSASQHLRLIVQRSSLDRRAEPRVNAQRSSSHSESLTWQWRRTAGTQLFVGASRASAGAGAPRDSEVFIKLQLDAAELGGWW